MKRIIILLLAVALTACSAPATPTQPAAPAVVEPSATPVVVVQTVIVEASPAPTEVPPTAVPPTVAPPVVVTVVVEPTQASAAVAPTQTSSGNEPITLDVALGRGVFSSMTMSGNAFTLRCFPRDITFNVTTPNVDITEIAFFYRIVDLKRLYPSEWQTFGKNMTANGNGNFTLTFTGENVNPNVRVDGSWFEFQFVGLNKGGGVVDRSEKIEGLVKYTFDCP